MEGRGADYWKETQKVGGYRGNTFIKPPAGGDGGLRGGGERGAARWLQITVVSAAAFSRWRSVEEGRRGRVSQNMLANCHTHTLTRTRANTHGHTLQRRVKSRRLENESTRFSSSTRELTEEPQCCKKKKKEKKNFWLDWSWEGRGRRRRS